MIETFDSAAQLGTFLSALAALVALVVGVRIYRRQTNTQVFLEYTARFNRVMDDFPRDALMARFDLDAVLPEGSDDLTLAVLRYLNLCSEEFYLFRRGYLAEDIWEIWRDELERMIRSPLLRREWKQLRSEFDSFPEFVAYVETCQRMA